MILWQHHQDKRQARPDRSFTGHLRVGISGQRSELPWQFISPLLRCLSAAKLLRKTYRLNRRKWSKRCSHRRRRLRPRKTSRFRNLLLRPRFNLNLLKKEHRHRDHHKRRRNLCQLRARDRCRCRERRPSPYMRPGLNILTKLVRGTSPGVEPSFAQ